MAALALLALAASLWMVRFVTEGLPHIEDEITYLFQARTFARGALWAPPPPDSRSFFVPFALIVNHHWIGKYPIGWPLLLAVGERFGAGWLVNPVLGALLVVLTALLGRDLAGRRVGLLAGALALSSPFFLIQSGTVMSHMAGACWLALFMWAGLRLDLARESGRGARGWAALAGVALGMLALTRPVTALAAAAPFGVALIVRALRGRDALREVLWAVWPVALIAALLAALQPLYLALATGSPTTNLYALVWPYDRFGFGPGIGPQGEHTLRQGLIHARHDLRLWSGDLFGWPGASWVAPLAGLIVGLKDLPPKRKGWPLLLAAPFAALVVVHVGYWVGAQVYGPRYYFEAHSGLAVLAALGLRGAARLFAQLIARVRRQHAAQGWSIALLLLAGLVALSATVYLPRRLDDWTAVYGITRQPIEALEEARRSDRVLVFVRGRQWVEYAALFSLNTPWLDGPVVAAHDLAPAINQAIIARFPGREVWYARGSELSPVPFPYTE